MNPDKYAVSVADFAFLDDNMIFSVLVVHKADDAETAVHGRKVGYRYNFDADILAATGAIEVFGAFPEELDILGDNFFYFWMFHGIGIVLHNYNLDPYMYLPYYEKK
jgi:hypothetical protein